MSEAFGPAVTPQPQKGTLKQVAHMNMLHMYAKHVQQQIEMWCEHACTFKNQSQLMLCLKDPLLNSAYARDMKELVLLLSKV